MATKGSRNDPAWKYGTEVTIEGRKKPYKYLKCKFCSKVIKGGVKIMKEHLPCTHKDVATCPNVPIEVKDEITLYLKTFESTKFMAQHNFEENVECGAYFVNLDNSSSLGV